MKKLSGWSFFCSVVLLTVAAHAQKPSADLILPILGNYANKSVPLGGSAILTPDTGASGIGTATVSISGNFKGSVTVSPSSGAVRVLNAYPAGVYTVTVRAADFAGFSVTRSFALSVTNVSSCNTLNFTGIRTTVGNNVNGIVAADFNGDGRQDTATSNFASNNISVLLGNGSGSFGTVTNFALPSGTASPTSIAVGDFNGDNKADLAVGSMIANFAQISVFSGNGTGGFGAPVNYPVAGGILISNIAVGDFNGDGRQDIAARTNSNALFILTRNAANNGFDAATNFNLGFQVNSLAAADFNADGRHDLVVGRSFTNTVVALIRNASNNGFDQVSLTVNGSVSQVIIGDFTGDGRQDIAASYSGGLDVLPRNALGFDPPVSVSFAGTSALQAGDFNNDGRLDIAFTTGTQAGIAYRNAANTNFDPGVNLGGAGGQLAGLAAADFNNDGRADLALLNFSSNSPGSVSVLRRNGTNQNFDLSPTTTLGTTNFNDAALGDFDNDGRQDLATVSNGSSNIAVYKGSGNGGFANLTNAVLSNGNSSNGTIAAADFNNDGNTDLIVGNNNINGFSLLQGAGNGSFAGAIDFPIGFIPQRLAVGDFNGDGRQDLVMNPPNSGQISIFLRNAANSGFDSAINISHSGTVNSLIVGDFNNDGNDDYAVSLIFNPISVVLRNAGNNGFDAPVNYTGGSSGGIAAADFNGDGNLDIVYGANSVVVYYGSATGVFGQPMSYGGSLTAGYVETGDFNGDGQQDIVAAVSNFSGANLVVLLRNAANNGFAPLVPFTGSNISSNAAQKILVGEINGDGRQDLIGSLGNFSVPAHFSVMTRVCAVDLNLTSVLPVGTAGQFYSKTIYANGGVAPYNFDVSGLPNGLNYTTTADSLTIFGTPGAGGQFNVSVSVSDSNVVAGSWESQSIPQASNQLTQVLPLTIAFAPTAAGVSISGRVLTPNGRGLANAFVVLTDASGNIKTARTTPFGYYRFEDIGAGRTYILSVQSKRFRFTPRILTINEEVVELDLTGIE